MWLVAEPILLDKGKTNSSSPVVWPETCWLAAPRCGLGQPLCGLGAAVRRCKTLSIISMQVNTLVPDVGGQQTFAYANLDPKLYLTVNCLPRKFHRDNAR